ncbi:2-hydroxyacyl-CoA dehydratase [Sphingomonas sp. ASY06-1R]|uniref:2-hydroxyacyl-CoA dehydratase n=1 Tax=Sphingomonas sp. ASY06-1R TaxID=3445771 RepID=UPI003FA2DE64
MMMLDTLVDRTLADPLAAARAAPRAIGYVGLDIPEDLLAASGRFALHLPWDADRPTPKADGWLENGFAPWARSILEQWAAGAFDFIDHVIFSRGEDSAQRLYYYVTELQRRGLIAGPKPLIFDVARIRRDSSAAHSILATRKLADKLDVTEQALSHGIAAANRRRTFFQSIAQTRSGSGRRYERIARAALFAPLEDATVDTLGAPSHIAKRVLLAGTAPPDDRIHAAVETAGWQVSGEAHERALDRLGAPIAVDGDPFAAIGRRAQAARFNARSFDDPAAALLEAARQARADAVILWLIEQEESMVWHVPPQIATMAQAGIPMLVLTRRRWDGNDGAAAEIAAWLTERNA